MTRLPLACAVMLLPAMVAGSVYGAASTQRENAAESGRIERARLRAFTRRANNYLVNKCDADGRFTYRIMLNPQMTVSERYNMLRHAGTMSAMIDFEKRYPDSNTRAALTRAAQYMQDVATGPVGGDTNMLAIWTREQVTGYTNTPLKAKLGGAGLALTALTMLTDVVPEAASRHDMRRLGRFIQFMQHDDGSFYSKYIPCEGGRSDRWTSLYYPGEAALGLILLYERDPFSGWLQSAADAIGYLAQSRQGKAGLPMDHWALIATARLLPYYDLCPSPSVTRRQLITHAETICDLMVPDDPFFTPGLPGYGCMTADGRTTPTATRLEGLLSAMQFLPTGNRALWAKITPAAHAGVDFLLRAQVKQGEHAGAVPRVVRTLPTAHPDYTRSFNRRATEVRIDYVQHALSAILLYEDFYYRNKRIRLPDSSGSGIP